MPKSTRILLTCCGLTLLACLFALRASAKPETTMKFSTIREENPQGAKETLVLPYAFSSESLGLTLGIGGGMKGYGQDQLLVGGTVFSSFDEASGFIGGIWDYRIPGTRRLYLSLLGSAGYYPRQRAYSSPQFLARRSRPGSNTSDSEDYLEASGHDNWFDLRLEYVLPLGDAESREEQIYHLRNGMPTSDGAAAGSWNPLKRGVTLLMLRQYNRYQDFETDDGVLDRAIHPVEFAVSHYNTDFPPNPSSGSSQYLSVTRDFGWLEAEYPWTFVEFEASAYFSLGKTDWARQRVVAMNVWTGDAPTWKESTDANGNTIVTDRPPHYEGANLGGLYRLRAFPMHRFNGRSVIYATTEYRYTPVWNPLGDISWLKFLKVDWWQFVGFVEAGRVADAYDMSVLLDEVRLDGGVAVRTMMAGVVIRLDVAVSDEGASAWVMFGHPF